MQSTSFILAFFLVGLNLLFTVIPSFGIQGGDPWCRSNIRRNWRFPPPPPPGHYRPQGAPSFRRPFPPANLPGRPHIILYQHENHNGFKYEQTVGPRCYNLPNVINDKASSVDTNNRCVEVCRDKDCKSCKQMKNGSPGHFKLREIDMDDQITSIQPCGEIYE